jgi:hypothetical protein
MYRDSVVKSLVKWCIVMGSGNLVNEKPTTIPALIALLQDRDYQTVSSGRPLLYLLPDDTPPPTLHQKVNTLRAAAMSASLGEPYVVLLTGAVKGAAALNGADAIGIYSKPNVAPKAAPYSDLAASTEAYWKTIAATGQSVVPTALTGADRRPRIERPVPWEAPYQNPYVGIENYYQAGTPAAIAAHVRDMVQWIAANKATCPAQTGLVYSWDEHDEGGSTLSPSVGDGDTILKALRKVL